MSEISLGYRGERGVEAKGLLAGDVSAEISRFCTLDAGLGLSFFQQKGIAGYGVGVKGQHPAVKWLSLKLGFQHEEWSDWRVGENRAYALLHTNVGQTFKFALALGLTRRQPIFDEAHFHEPWFWKSSVGEWNLLYRLEFRFGDWKNSTATGYLANFNNLTLHNPQQFPFGIRVAYSLSPLWKVFIRFGSAVNGFSAMLLSFPEIEAEVGVRYAP